MTVITEAFKTAATIRAKVLGMPQHPTVVVEHPMASKTETEVLEMAKHHLGAIVGSLVRKT